MISMIPIPTYNQFNAMTKEQQRAFVDYETAGHIEPNIAGYLIYENENVFISYERDGAGRLNKAEAETLVQAVQRGIMHIVAKRAMESNRNN